MFVYFVRSGNHNLLIDTGWHSEESYLALKSAMEYIGTPIADLDKIVVSHLHPDHYGLSKRLKEEAPNCTMMMHRSDSHSIADTSKGFETFLESLHEWLHIHGTPESELKEMIDSSAMMLKLAPPAQPDVELIGGEVIRVGENFEFQVIPAPGHTIGNLCLYESSGSEIFFSGDHILPTITPNISLSPLYRGDPLGDYLESLDRLRRLHVSKVLPSHEYVFSNLAERIDQIEKHHKERLQDALSILDKEKESTSAYDVASKLHWYAGSWEVLTPWEKRAALMETLAHLEYLKRRGRVAEIEEHTGESSRILYASFADKC